MGFHWFRRVSCNPGFELRGVHMNQLNSSPQSQIGGKLGFLPIHSGSEWFFSDKMRLSQMLRGAPKKGWFGFYFVFVDSGFP